MRLFDAVRSLFPKGGAFNSVSDGGLRKMCKALSKLPENFWNFAAETYGDLWPDWTREVEGWERQFGVTFARTYDDEVRRTLLKVLWNIGRGGQGASRIENILQIISPEMKVVENVPVRNPPRAAEAIYSRAKNRIMRCGYSKGRCKYSIGDSSFTPTIIRNGASSVYDIPNDEKFWRNTFFICSGVIRDPSGNISYVTKITLDKKWRTLLEFLVLRIKPAHTTAIVYVKYQ